MPLFRDVLTQLPLMLLATSGLPLSGLEMDLPPLLWDGVIIFWKTESLSESVDDVEATDSIDTMDILAFILTPPGMTSSTVCVDELEVEDLLLMLESTLSSRPVAVFLMSFDAKLRGVGALLKLISTFFLLSEDCGDLFLLLLSRDLGLGLTIDDLLFSSDEEDDDAADFLLNLPGTIMDWVLWKSSSDELLRSCSFSGMLSNFLISLSTFPIGMIFSTSVSESELLDFGLSRS